MPFKIYTYCDPYRLSATNFWDEVNSVPHLCVSQTLVNGLRDLYEFESALLPIDNVLSELYSDWHRNVERQIAQYSALSEVLLELKVSQKMNEHFYSAFKHNQSELLNALRLLVELKIDHTRLYKQNAYPEQCFLIELYEMICQGKLSQIFDFPEITDLADINKSIRLAFEMDMSRYTNEQVEDGSDKVHSSRINWYKRVLKNLGATNLTRVVIHGLHQFTPLQLRFIYALHNAGVEIVFLFNYQESFKEIYSTWQYVYSQFDVKISQDTNVTDYPFSQDSTSHALASRIAQLLDPGINHYSVQFDWSEQLKNVQFIEFDNVTEFAGYVASYFEEAGKSLRAMTEQVYSAGSEVHDLLRIYYPEIAGDRHFLAYPIGQFFTCLYKMWDPVANQLQLDMNYLRECLAAGLLGSVPSEKLTAIFQNTRHYFEDVKHFDQFKKRMKHYIAKYEEIHHGTGSKLKWLRKLSIYNPEYVKRDDLDILLDIVETLNETAKSLFEPENGQNGFIVFKGHFDKLEEFIRQRLPETLVIKEERRLIEDLLARFTSIKHGVISKGTIEDLRMGLTYYLRQKEVERANWIVRNFEQIDGDVLRSRNQGDERCYHFACLSDRDLNKKVDDLLPWPLTDYFITKSYTPVEQHFQVYYAALGEYGNFLRYALFYGMCFNEKNVRLSYIRNCNDETLQPYFLLRMMGLEPIRWAGSSLDHVDVTPSNTVKTINRGIIISDNNWAQVMDFILCPYKFLLDYAFKGDIIPNSQFLYQHFYVNMLIARVWFKIQNHPIELERPRIRSYIEKAHEDIAPFFPFWREVNDITDLKNQVYNYITCSGQLQAGHQYKGYNPDFMEIRFLFKKAKFDYKDSDELDIHPYKAAHRYYCSYTKDEKLYTYISLPKFRSYIPDNVNNAIQEYLVYESLSKEHLGDWCTYCSHKGALCLKPYML